MEGSREVDEIPGGVYLKTAIFVGIGLLILQVIAIAARYFKNIFKGDGSG